MVYRQPLAILPSLSAETQVCPPEAYGNTGGVFNSSPGQAEFSFGNRELGCAYHGKKTNTDFSTNIPSSLKSVENTQI